jgi:hypothetical protein
MSFLKASQKQLALVAAGAFLSGVAASRLGGMVRLLAARLSTAAPTLPTEANEKDEHFPEWVEHLVNHEYVEIDEGMPAFLKLCADVGASQVRVCEYMYMRVCLYIVIYVFTTMHCSAGTSTAPSRNT